MKTQNTEAVIIEGREAVLEVTYKIDEESDSNRFTVLFGGWNGKTKEDAILEVVEDAKTWADSMRAQYDEVSVWDATGNWY